MASIQGEDHRRLADLLDHRVGQLEGKVDQNSRHAQLVSVEVARVAVKLDTLLDAHKETHAVVREVHARVDAHLEGHDKQPGAPPSTVVGLLATHPWLIPVMLMLGTIMFGSTAFLAYLER